MKKKGGNNVGQYRVYVETEVWLDVEANSFDEAKDIAKSTSRKQFSTEEDHENERLWNIAKIKDLKSNSVRGYCSQW